MPVEIRGLGAEHAGAAVRDGLGDLATREQGFCTPLKPWKIPLPLLKHRQVEMVLAPHSNVMLFKELGSGIFYSLIKEL